MDKELGYVKEKSLVLKVKYLQVEPGARVKLHEIKHFMPDTADVSTCHKVKVYNEGLTSKGTSMGDDIKETVVEDIPVNIPDDIKTISEKLEADKQSVSTLIPPADVKEEEVYDVKPFSGFFRDNKKRIDLVLVIEDDGNSKPDIDKFKMNYLISIIKTGLEVELENGLMDEHKNFIFVKVHAPDAVIKEYGEMLGIKKYFKNNHLNKIGSKNMCFNCNLCTNIKHEREWIEIVRRNYEKPSNYSNSDRSLLVYKILLYLPFDGYDNHFGLKRLLNKNIILDAYALHDGPYFFTKHQDVTNTNGRQILFRNWVGYWNTFKMQPINLITEYLGSRIGFYFVFLQFINYGFLYGLVGGVAMTVYGILDNTYAEYTKAICDKKTEFNEIPMCPRCMYRSVFEYQKSCPRWKIPTYYCLAAKFTAVLDNNFIIGFALYMAIGAPIFIAFWSRRENYLKWLWELYYVKRLPTIRVECVYDFENPARSSKTGILIYNRKLWHLFLNAITYSSIILVAIVLSVWLAEIDSTSFPYHVKNLLNMKYRKSLERYIYIFYFSIFYLAVFYIYEQVFKNLIRVVIFLENHRTEEAYERSLILKRVTITVSSIVFILFYFTFYKGIQYRPLHYKQKYFNKNLYSNCDPVTCIDETCIMLFGIILFRIIAPKWRMFWVFCCSTTDYNQRKKVVQTIPVWEREYKLKPITETDLMEKYLALMLQFIVVVFYAPAFPIASLIMFIINLNDIRVDAYDILLTRRRPLLLERSGIESWAETFTFLSFLATVTNGMLIGRSSRMAKKYYVLNKLKRNMTQLFPSLYVAIRMWEIGRTVYGKKVPSYIGWRNRWDRKFCVVAGNITRYNKPTTSDIFAPHKEHYEIPKYEYYLMTIFYVIAIIAAVIGRKLITSNPPDVKESIEAEENIINTQTDFK